MVVLRSEPQGAAGGEESPPWANLSSRGLGYAVTEPKAAR